MTFIAGGLLLVGAAVATAVIAIQERRARYRQNLQEAEDEADSVGA